MSADLEPKYAKSRLKTGLLRRLNSRLTWVSGKVEIGGFQPKALVDLNKGASKFLYFYPFQASLASAILSEQYHRLIEKT